MYILKSELELLLILSLFLHNINLIMPVVNLVLITVCNLFFLYSTMIFLLHTDIATIRHRVPMLTVVQSTLCLILVNVSLGTVKCETETALVVFLFPIIMFLLLVKCVWVAEEYWKNTHEMAQSIRTMVQQKVSSFKRLSGETPTEQRLSNAERYATWRITVCGFIKKALVTAVIGVYAIAFLALLLTKHKGFSCAIDQAAVQMLIPGMVMNGLLCPIAVVLLYKVREQFGILKEIALNMLLLLAIGASVMFYRPAVALLFLIHIINVAVPGLHTYVCEMKRIYDEECISNCGEILRKTELRQYAIEEFNVAPLAAYHQNNQITKELQLLCIRFSNKSL